MKIRFAADVLARPSTSGRELYAIAACFDCGQHQWEIDDLDALLGSAWMRGLPTWDALDELAEKSYRAAIDEPALHPPRWLVVVTDAAPGVTERVVYCDPGEARRLATNPLRVILENATSDGGFVRSVAATYAATAVTTAIAKGWLVFDQAGGSGEFVKRATALLALSVPPLRILCLMDSDRLVPGPLPPTVAKRCSELTALGVDSFVLHKREVENYLPPSAIDRDRTRSVYVSWLRLTPVQQDHYDMKYGFREDPKTGEASLLAEQEGLFADVSQWHRRRLIGGFGKAVGECFDGEPLDAKELEARCESKPGELRELVSWLEAAL